MQDQTLASMEKGSQMESDVKDLQLPAAVNVGPCPEV